MLEEFTGIGGSAYSTRKSRAINWAQVEINSVKWDFLFDEGTGFNTVAGTKVYSLDTDFLHPHKFYINDGSTVYELIPGISEDIVLNPPSTTGVPKYYCLAGVSGGLPRVYIGYPTADDAYAVTYGFYKQLSDISGSTHSEISIAWRDDPIITGAVYKFWQYVEEPAKAEQAYGKFWQAMKEMEENMPFTGESWTSRHPLPQG